jgi:probable F420-dependent oxidoreductase
VDYGVAMFTTDYTVDPGTFARSAEERGFDSVYFPEHTHIPVKRDSPWPGGGDLPKEYWHLHDLFVALTAAAAATKTIKIGSGICLIIERDPITTANEVASVDHLSGGRLIFGIGAGWNREEMANHGTDPAKRFRVMRERVEAMTEIWTKDEAEYHGEFVDFDPIWSWPKPIQKPRPPVMIGGMGKTVIDRVLDFGDGWFPQPGRMDTEEFAARIEELPRRAAEAGREVSMSVFGARPDLAAIERYEQAGANRAVFWIPPAERDEAERKLDELVGQLGMGS